MLSGRLRPGVLAQLPTKELRDIDCLEVRSLWLFEAFEVRSSHVDWASIRLENPLFSLVGLSQAPDVAV